MSVRIHLRRVVGLALVSVFACEAPSPPNVLRRPSATAEPEGPAAPEQATLEPRAEPTTPVEEENEEPSVEVTAVDGGVLEAGARDAASQRTLADNVAAALAYGRSVVGAPYGWWYSGPLPAGAPMWTARGPAPPAATVRAASANCAGLTNLMLRAIGKRLPSSPVAGTGGTGAYGAFYASVARPFDPARRYPAGTLIGRRYRDNVDQGHVAVVLDDGRVLQSFADVYGGTVPGVNARFTVEASNGAGFYEYAVLPQDWLAPD